MAVNIVTCSGGNGEEVEGNDKEESSPKVSSHNFNFKRDVKVMAILEALRARMGWKQSFHLPIEIRQQVAFTLTHPELNTDKICDSEKDMTKYVTCSAALAFIYEDLLLGSKPHNRLLFVSAYILE